MKQVCVEPLLSALNMMLPAFAAKHGHPKGVSIEGWYAAPTPAAIDRHILPAGCSAANSPAAVAAIDDGTNRQIDGCLAIIQTLHCIVCGQCR